MGKKQPEHKAGHLHSFGAKVKNGWNYAYIPPYVFMLCCLMRHSDSFIFFFYLGVPRDPVPASSKQHVGIPEGYFNFLIFF